MIRWNRRILKIVIIFFAILTFSYDVYGNDLTKVPDKIKIGIRYGQSATPVVSLSAKSGLELGTYMGNEFKRSIDFVDSEEIYVRKDSFFMKLNGTFIAYDYDEEKDKDNSSIYGPVHIQVGDGFSSIEEAQNLMDSLFTLNVNPYLVNEGGWKVWIGLYTSLENAQKALDQLRQVVSAQQLKIIPSDNRRVQVVDKSGKVLFMYNTSDSTYYFRSIPQKDTLDIIQLDGKSFRGNILIKRFTNSDLTVINEINLEEYLYGVVPREMSGTWPIEALKAQAVAARNYTIVNLKKHGNYEFDLCATTDCQVYGGYSSEHPNSTKAVDETKGKLLTYGGKVITAFYHSNSGGHTEDSENIWSNPLGYIRGVEDIYSIGNPNDTWSISYTNQQIEDILVSKGINIGKLINMTVTEYSKYGRVLQMEVNGTNGKEILKKEKVRSVFGYNNIKSTWFNLGTDGDINVLSHVNSPIKKINLTNKFVITSHGTKSITSDGSQYIYNGNELKSISANTSKYVFNGKGWGHGLGMSQWGAKSMAEKGYNYEDILTHYYTGTKIE